MACRFLYGRDLDGFSLGLDRFHGTTPGVLLMPQSARAGGSAAIRLWAERFGSTATRSGTGEDGGHVNEMRISVDTWK